MASSHTDWANAQGDPGQNLYRQEPVTILVSTGLSYGATEANLVLLPGHLYRFRCSAVGHKVRYRTFTGALDHPADWPVMYVGVAERINPYISDFQYIGFLAGEQFCWLLADPRRMMSWPIEEVKDHGNAAQFK